MSLFARIARKIRTNRSRKPQRQQYRPTLESLESRITPATRVWTGAGATFFWDAAMNWQGGQIAGAGDEVIIDLAAANHWYPKVAAGVTKEIGSIRVVRQNPNNDPTVNPQFAGQKQLEIDGSLKITSANGKTSDWAVGHIDLNQNGALIVNGYFDWNGGEILSLTGNGSIFVYAEFPNDPAIINVGVSASKLEANLFVGYTPTFEVFTGDVVFTGTMLGNLNIRKDAMIGVSALGAIEFEHIAVGQEGAVGGIFGGAASPNSKIVNAGVVYRDITNGKYVSIDIPIHNEEFGRIRVGEFSALKVDASHVAYDIVQDTSELLNPSIVLEGQSKLIVPNGGIYVNSGELVIESDPLADTSVEIVGDVTIAGGTMRIGHLPNLYVDLTVGTLTLLGGRLELSIHGPTEERGDSIFAQTLIVNPFAGDDAVLDITVDGQLGASQDWTIIQYNDLMGTDFAAYDFNGADLTAQLGLNALTLTSNSN